MESTTQTSSAVDTDTHQSAVAILMSFDGEITDRDILLKYLRSDDDCSQYDDAPI